MQIPTYLPTFARSGPSFEKAQKIILIEFNREVVEHFLKLQKWIFPYEHVLKLI